MTKLNFQELSYEIYANFGQTAIENFIKDRQKEKQLLDVTWGLCSPCENYSSPIYEENCLICGTEIEEEEKQEQELWDTENNNA